MKLNYLFFALLIFTLVLPSCNKDEEDDANPEIPLIATVTLSVSGYSAADSFKYDNKGRIKYHSSKMTYNTQSVFYQTYYTYSSSSVIDEVYVNGVKNPGTVYNLNGQGLCSHFKRGDETDTFKYNQDRYLTSKIVNLPTFQINCTYTINNGNTVQSNAKNNENGISHSQITDYEFYNDTINTIGDANKGLKIFGQQNKNLIKTYSYGNNKFHYTYTLDEKKRVVQQESLSGEKYIFTYY